jgi:ABC-type multidrug transport system fused ATPase/permease subunit
MLGAPRGMSALFSRSTKRKLVLAIMGSLMAALLEAIGVAAVLPLMQLVTGTGLDSGALELVDRLFGRPSESRLATYTALLVFCAFLLKACYTLAFRFWMAKFLAEQESETATALLDRYLAAPYWVHLQRNTASFVRTMTEAVGQTYGMVVSGAIAGLSEAISILVLAGVLLVLNPVPALAVIAYFLVLGLVYERLVRKPAVQAGKELQDSSLAMSVLTWQSLGAVKEIRVRRNSPHFVQGYSEARKSYTKARRMATFLADLPRSVFEVAFILGVSLLTMASLAVGDGASAVTTLALFVAAGFRMMPSLTRIIASLQMIRMGEKGVELLLDDMTNETLREAERGDVQRSHRTRIDREILVDAVTFRYPLTEAPVLRDVSLRIPRATSLAIAGRSGAGKSTLVDIVLGLHVPQHGDVLVDDLSIHRDLPGWQRSIGLVPQDVYLVDDTIRANIAFGEPEDAFSAERFDAAIRSAQLEDLIDELPHGAETMVGERGARLSGGQRQRLGIARALYHAPDVLVFDEATSALDNETERRISETLAQLSRRVTIIIVAHRLSTVRMCDQVAFLSEGRVVATGTFEEVRAASPEFAHLVSLGSLEPA